MALFLEGYVPLERTVKGMVKIPVKGFLTVSKGALAAGSKGKSKSKSKSKGKSKRGPGRPKGSKNKKKS